MPRLNQIRFAHLEYNHGRSVIPDQILDIGGVNTLLKMENGGGKSVMTQMLLAPYVSARNRSFPTRKFADYFRDPKPTFIVQEWIKDGDAGLFSVGFMVSRRPASEEMNGQRSQEDERINLYAWISEYDNYSEPGSLSSLELLKPEKSGRKSYLQFKDAKNMLEGLEKNGRGQFDLYNLSNTAQRKNYFARLHSLGFEQGEWDEMRKFNLEESGLSNFCIRYNTQDKLIRDLLIPQAAKKMDRLAGLNDLDSHTTKFAQEVYDFSNLYARNRQNLKEKALYEAFLEELQGLYQQSLQLQFEEKELQERQRQIAVLNASIVQALQAFEQEKGEYQEMIAIARQDILHLNHEILSAKWYEYSEARESYEAKEAKTRAELEGQKSEQEELQQLLNRLECAKLAEEIRKNEALAIEFEEKANSARLSELDIQEKQNGYGAALYSLYQTKTEAAKTASKNGQQHLEQIEDDLKAGEKKQKSLQTRQNELLKKESALETRIQDFFTQEEQTLSTLNESIHHTLEWKDDGRLYEILCTRLADALQTAADLQQKANAERAGLQQSLEKENESKQALLLSRQQTETNIQKAEETVQKNQSDLEQRRQLFTALSLEDETRFWDAKSFQNSFDAKMAVYDSRLEQARKRLASAEQNLSNLETGTSLELSAEMKQVFETLQIEPVTGVQWLRESRMGEKKKRDILQKHPLFAYSLILDPDTIESIQEEFRKCNLYSMQPVFMASRKMLDAKEDVRFEGYPLYANVNENLIFPEELEALKNQAEKSIAGEKAYLKNEGQNQNDLAQLYQTVLKTGLTQKKLEEDQKALENLRTLKAQQSDQIAQADLNIGHLKKEIRSKTKQIGELDQAAEKAKKKKELGESLAAAFRTAAENQNALESIQQQRKQLSEELAVQSQKLESLQNEKTQAALRLQKLNKIFDDLEEKTKTFASFENYEPAAGSIEELEPRFESLAQKLSESQYGAYHDSQIHYETEVRDRKKELQETAKSYQLQEEDWKSLTYSTETKLNSQKRLKALQTSIGKLQKTLQDLTGRISFEQGRLTNTEEQMEKECQSSQPLPKNEIRKEGVKELLETAKAEQDQVSQALDALVLKSSQFEQTAKTTEKECGDEEVPAEMDIKNWSAQELSEDFASKLDARNKQQKSFQDLSSKIDRDVSRLMADYRSKKPVCIDVLTGIQGAIAHPDAMPAEIIQKQTLINNHLGKTMEDLQFLEENRQQMISQLFEYVRELHQHLNQIDQDTTITLNGSVRKMLQIQTDDWQTREDAARIRMEEYLDQLLKTLETIQTSSAIRETSSEIQKTIQQAVSPSALYDAVLGISSVRVFVIKVEETQTIRINWEQAGGMSGAEGFLCAFIVVSAVLNFQRKDAASRLYGKKAGHLLLLDNPFAYVQSGHIIDALMQLCKTTATQLVAFSNVGNAEVINAFANIYTLRMIPMFDERSHLKAERDKEPAGRQVEGHRIQVLEGDLTDRELLDEEAEEGIQTAPVYEQTVLDI